MADRAEQLGEEIYALQRYAAEKLQTYPKSKGGRPSERVRDALIFRLIAIEAWLEAEDQGARNKPDRTRTSPFSSQRRGQGTLVSRRASGIEPEAISWLWPQRIARGKITLIAGLPGLGKSQVTTDMSAITSSGGTWPTGEASDACDVPVLSAEDDPADTIRPRLRPVAQPNPVHIIEAVRYDRGEKLFNLEDDVEALANYLVTHPGTKLVIVDPIDAYLGRTDSHKNAEVRRVLAPLAKLAADHDVAFLGVTHLSKSLKSLRKPLGTRDWQHSIRCSGSRRLPRRAG